MSFVFLILTLILVLAVTYVLSIPAYHYLHGRKSSQEKYANLQSGLKQSRNILSAVVFLQAGQGQKAYHIGKQMTLETPYAIGAISHLMVTAAIYQCLDQDLIKKEQSIEEILPLSMIQGLLGQEGAGGRPITVCNLLDQTSGLPPQSRPVWDTQLLVPMPKQGEPSPQTIIDCVKLEGVEATADSPANGKVQASLLNAFILALIVQEVHHASLYQVFHQCFFEPLGMAHTGLVGTLGTDLGRGAFKETSTWDKCQAALIVLSDLRSTATDQMAFLKAFYQGQLFNANHLSKVTFRHLGQEHAGYYYGGGMMEAHQSIFLSPYLLKPSLRGYSGGNGSFAYYVPGRDLYIVGTLSQERFISTHFLYHYVDAWQ